MKITDVRAYVVEPLTWTWAGDTRPLRWMFVRIDTDEKDRLGFVATRRLEFDRFDEDG